ncbi:head maturation protease, ClpP-related [Methylobacterium thuringiense]|uniref:ATP-dependent Clp protease proteolytic subunit n=1 Tax=Methylobacterium thuringiense TaxID=1003091 RepID=A0ABQ4TKL4_9HYPH|nr:head maturation protease, ClpP-related [Methylobacterium thuringiense]GJE54570.1 ATP-dependent Clp protease proteolytic subunit [Methylobacterium thuringiense]
MAVLVSGSEIVLSGTVGNLYWDDCFDSADVILALAQVGRDQDVVIRLNSGGGIATEGAAIHAALCAHRGRKTIIVEGVAASAASVIAMAGDEIVMALGAIMMIHDPSGFTFGTVVDHELQIRALTSLATAMAGIYAERSGKTSDEARADMKAELWMSPEEAVEAGYADRIQGRVAESGASGGTTVVDAEAGDDMDGPEPTAFDFRLYQHPPERLVALADRRAWTNRARPTASAPKAALSPKPKHTEEAPVAGSETKPAGTSAEPQASPASNVVQIDEARAAGRAEALATAMPRAQASEIAKLCHDGGLPEMTASLLAEGATVEQAKGRIQMAGQVKDMVALARRTNPDIPEAFASTMLAEGKTLDQARATLFDKMVARDEETVVTSHQAPQRQAAAGPEATKSNMRAQLERSGLLKKGA